jgi:hypothetical protein
MYNYYIHETGDIYNVKKGCMQNIRGKFLRRVFPEYEKYIIENSIPCVFPENIKDAEVPIWNLLWIVNIGSDKVYCFTRKQEGFDREYCTLLNPATNKEENTAEIVDTDIYPIYSRTDYPKVLGVDKIELVESSFYSEATLEEVFGLYLSQISKK